MKILIIRNIPTYMEVRNTTYNIQEVGLAGALVRRGHTCDILFWTDRAEETVELPVYSGGASDGAAPDGEGSDDACGRIRVFYRRGRSLFKNTVFTGCGELFDSYDILQPVEYNQAQSWLLAGSYPDKTIIYHGPYYSPFNKRYNLMCRVFDALFLRRYLRRNTHFLVKSGLAGEFLVGKGILPECVYTAFVGMDAQMLENKDPGAAGNPLLRSIRDDESPLKLLYIGRFEERRNLPFVIDVFSAVLARCPAARLYMIGTGDADYVQMVERHMEETGTAGHIVRQERMEQQYLAQVYRSADIFLLPTHYEIFGMVLLEAMYYGNAVLTTRNGGSDTLIRDGENGFVLDAEDPSVWADRILQLYDAPEERALIGCSAHRTVAEYFTWDALADRFLEAYRGIRG